MDQFSMFNFDRKNPVQLLHAQAVASLMIIANYVQNLPKDAPTRGCARLLRIDRMAQARCARRFQLAYGSK